MLPFVVGLPYKVVMAYTQTMAKEPALGIRLEASERKALENAAKADQRPLSAMSRKIIVDWLRANGWFSDDEPDLRRKKEAEG